MRGSYLRSTDLGLSEGGDLSPHSDNPKCAEGDRAALLALQSLQRLFRVAGDARGGFASREGLQNLARGGGADHLQRFDRPQDAQRLWRRDDDQALDQLLDAAAGLGRGLRVEELQQRRQRFLTELRQVAR